MVVISVPLMITISALFVQPVLNDTELADLSIYTRIFDIVILGYILRASLKSLVKATNVKLLYVPAVFGLLWLEQYSLLTSYFDYSLSAFIGSLLARLAGLTLFVYAIHYALAKARISGDVEIEQEKRHKLQLFYEILCSIEEDMINNKGSRPTHIQHTSRLSYDKLMNHFIKLDKTHDTT